MGEPRSRFEGTSSLSAKRRHTIALIGASSLCFVLGEAVLLGSFGVHVFADLAWTLASLWAAVECVLTARAAKTRTRRYAYALFAAAFFAWFAGMLAWDWDELVRRQITPFPALSDVGFLALVPFLIAGLLCYGAGGGTPGFTLKQLGDLGAVVSSLVFIGALVYSGPAASGTVGRGGLAVAAGNSVMHLAAVAFCLHFMWQRPSGERRLVLPLFFAGLVTKTGVTTVYGYFLLLGEYEAGHVLDVLWFVTFGLFAWSAREERWAEERVERTKLWEPSALDTFAPALTLLVTSFVAFAFRDALTSRLTVIGCLCVACFAISAGVRAYAIRKMERELRAEMHARERQFMEAQKMEAIGTLAGGIAHDFNNSLTAILAATTMLRMATPKGSRSASYVDIVEHGAQQATALSKRLLALSRESSPEMGAVRLADVVHRAAKLLHGTLPARIELKERIEVPRDFSVLASAVLLDQALLNLGINAGHAMPDGGTLTLVCRVTETEPREVIFEVIDTGVGIPEALRHRIFEPFFSTREAGRGTGLGLAMVYAAARHHDGTVDVESKVGAGSTFRITFPLQAPSREAESLELALDLPRGTETLLVVDDQDAPLIGIKTILVEAGYEVRLAWSGEEALRRIETDGVPALVITDAVMPGMGGAGLLAALRERGIDAPVVITSGYDDPIVDDEFAAVLRKPFAPEELAVTVRRVLDAHEKRRAHTRESGPSPRYPTA